MRLSPILLLAAYSILVVGASLVGGWLPTFWRWNHRLMQAVMSFVGGVMLGIAVLHLLPHSISETASADQSAISLLIGLVAIFLLIRVFHVHQHPTYPEACDRHPEHGEGEHWHDALDNVLPPIELPPLLSADDDRKVPAAETVEATGGSSHASTHRLSWIGLFAGMTIHTALDGVALAASLAHQHDEPGLAGLGAFLAVFLHKPLDALSITVLMVAGGWSRRWQFVVNVLFALICPFAAWAFFFTSGLPVLDSIPLVGWALGFSAGVFLCISLADILPEIQFHAHDRLLLTSLLLTGILVAWLLGFAEPHGLHAH